MGRVLEVFVILAVGLTAGALLTQCPRQLRIDKCLDGGGRWNYEAEHCER